MLVKVTHGKVITNQITKKRGNKWAIFNKSMTVD